MNAHAVMTSRASSADFLQAGGQLGELIRAKDWSLTPIGSPESWPQSLLTVVNLCLASNFPINIIWGPGHTQIYNDGYREVCGEVHPRALGESYRVTWASAWPAIGGPFEKALKGNTSYLENQRMFLSRNGYLEETFFTFSLSPIRDESGQIVGLFHPVTETTAAMLAERRTRALRDVSTALSPLPDEQSMVAQTIRTLAQFEFDLPYLLFYLYEAATDTYTLTASHGLRMGSALAPITISNAELNDWPFSVALHSEHVVEITSLSSFIKNEKCGPYPEASDSAFALSLRASSNEKPYGFFIAGVSSRLPLDETYRSFYNLLDVTIASAFTSMRAREDERRRAEALAEIDRAKTTFFSNVSHEFRTPLTLMLGPLEEILAKNPEHYSEQLVTVHRNGLRLLRLVNSLLDFSRVEAARANALYQATDIGAFTAELASNFRSACEMAGVKLEIHSATIQQLVYVDREMWEKIVLNLISNAFKFTFTGHIHVSVNADEISALLTIEDTGVGIPENELGRIFERFHRVDSAHGRSYEGSGIGLALVKELVQLMGGTIAVQSELGKGTTFVVHMPLGDAHMPVERRSNVLTEPTTTRINAFVEEATRWLPNGTNSTDSLSSPNANIENKPCVLLVDDNADMREYVQRLLANSYSVLLAKDGEEALKLIAQSVPDIVLTDVMMPNLDGFGLSKAIRENVKLRHLPIIMLSARAGEESRVLGADVGIDDYLVKPFNANELLARVATNLRIAELRRNTEERLVAGERDRRIGQAFQRAALPMTLPSISNMSFSALYEPASHEANVGGDFYDAFRLVDGRIVLSIGDVAGAGLAAAATMAAVRQSLRAVASVNPDPRMLLKAADDIFLDNDGPRFASAFVAVIDPLTLSVQYANAGHPPPLLRAPDGTITMLEGNDLLLGVMPHSVVSTRSVGRLSLAPGSILVLYTDGLTEYTRDVSEGESCLQSAVQAVCADQTPLAQFAQEVYAKVFAESTTSTDDVAVITVSIKERLGDSENTGVLRWALQAEDREAAAKTRSEMVKALTTYGCSVESRFSAEMVFSELIGNVIRYAGTTAEVLLDLTQAHPVLHVLDAGDGFSLNPKLPIDAYAECGRGLFIVNQLTLDFVVSPRTNTCGSHARAVLQTYN